MSTALADRPQVVHRLPGRLRVRIEDLSRPQQRTLEVSLRRLSGVTGVKSDVLTGTVLVTFAESVLKEQEVVEAIRLTLDQKDSQPALPDPRATSPVLFEQRVVHPTRTLRRIRVSVRGLDRDGGLSQRIKSRLKKYSGVRVHPNPLTGRVLLEFDENFDQLRELLEELSLVELPAAPGEDDPTHPLDPAPLKRSAVRAVGSGLGLGLVAAQRLTGSEGPALANPTTGYLAGVLSIAQGLPWVRTKLRTLFGRDNGDLALTAPDIVFGAINGNALSLLVNGIGALRLLSTVTARRDRWRQYEERIGEAPRSEPGEVVRIESGERNLLPAVVVEGKGTALDGDGLAFHFVPGDRLPAGSKLVGEGSFLVELGATDAFEPDERPKPLNKTFFDQYQALINPVGLVYATILGMVTRSPARAFEALLCLSPRAATAGAEAANLSASARVLKAGVTIVGTRPNRHVILPDRIFLQSARCLTDGLELDTVHGADPGVETSQVLDIAARVSHAAGSPWGDLFGAHSVCPEIGQFDGTRASAAFHGHTYGLELDADLDYRLRAQGKQALKLLRISNGRTEEVANLTIRPKIAPGVARFVKLCKESSVHLELLSPGDLQVTQEIGRRANVTVSSSQKSPAALIRSHQAHGESICFVADNVEAAEAFASSDLAVAISSGRSGGFPARADLLIPEIGLMSAVIDAGKLRKKTIADSVGISIAANLFGMATSWRGPTGIVAASRGVHAATLGTYAMGAVRFRGGKQFGSAANGLIDPKPEQKWGRPDLSTVLSQLEADRSGLSAPEAKRRLTLDSASWPEEIRKKNLLQTIWRQARSPMIGVLAAGAAFAVAAGTPVEFGLIILTIVANVFFGAWQERHADNAEHALATLSPNVARVIRDGKAQSVPARELVPGDVILLEHGDRVPADARLIEAQDLELDEAVLTGESLPVAKDPDSRFEASRIVLEGTAVTVGTASAVVVSVGKRTRLGSIGVALSNSEDTSNPLNDRLASLLTQFLPVTLLAASVVFGSGMLSGEGWLPAFVLAGTMALAAVPEGLPLLAGVAEVAVARRLSSRMVLLRKLSAVEALGRVDVACTDKTGTLTEGRLALGLVATIDKVALLGGDDSSISEKIKDVVLAAALASPHPDSPSARSHQTDGAISEGAEKLGLVAEMRAARDEEAPFEPTRPFHVAHVGGRLVIKGAPEAIARRCGWVRTEEGDIAIQQRGQEELLAQAENIASRGMRVLMVAVGNTSGTISDPQELTALGFVGIRDPVRKEVLDSVSRCRAAGIRVVMLTGDHPATAKAIAFEAGLIERDQSVLLGSDLASVSEEDLAKTLANVAVVARVTPLDKLRIVQGLQRLGHTVAMTGDGVNDAPALRLADVGVAMGKSGTEVARQVADVVLLDDDFSSLVEALVEGRGFWRNIRRALGLLLGGNIGELGLMAIPLAFGLPAPLNARHILAMNLLTDGLPALAVALQEPEQRNLSSLAREGTSALDKPLRKEVISRGAATLIPSVGAYLVALALDLPGAQTVAFASAICCQLAQTLATGRSGDKLSKTMAIAMGASISLLISSLAIPIVRSTLTLVVPSFSGLLLVAVASMIASSLAWIFGASVGPTRPDNGFQPSLLTPTYAS